MTKDSELVRQVREEQQKIMEELARKKRLAAKNPAIDVSDEGESLT